ncbi:MAG: hypothetical protein PHU64_06730 [Candidatus Omnitrophica bacterium]|nr:hypothetical protein [Candidatus Omnitrophota bacterium]MDD5430172.1 hypothetical protein [Candidatus Omnitrophota bacterium]
MKKILLGIAALLFINGCFAVVDDSSGERKVKSFMITQEETLDIVEKANEKPLEDKSIIYPFKAKK